MLRNVRDKMHATFEPVPPVKAGNGAIMQNIHQGEDVDLFMVPAPNWPALDGGRYIGTGDMVIQKDPDSGWVNMGTYRVQVLDKNTVALHANAGHHGAAEAGEATRSTRIARRKRVPATKSRYRPCI